MQTATDYLLGSFLSPALNHRRDEYGGSRENRARIVREVLAAVRGAAGPGMAVGVRCSARHDIPGAPSTTRSRNRSRRWRTSTRSAWSTTSA